MVLPQKAHRGPVITGPVLIHHSLALPILTHALLPRFPHAFAPLPTTLHPPLYSYEKEIVLYAHFKKLDYFSTECIYAPFAARGFAREFIKDLEVGTCGNGVGCQLKRVRKA